jgi:hypothetical protein
MTIVAVVSCCGAPGVTTLSCLLGATWPSEPVAVIEGDPSGGVLAARFHLSIRTGWASATAAARRDPDRWCLDDHLQELPGGLPVLLAPPGPTSEQGSVVDLVCSASVGTDLIIDLGRLSATDDVARQWLSCAEVIIVLSDGEGAALLALKAWWPRLNSWAPLLLAVRGPGLHGEREIEETIGARVAAWIPSDPGVAAVLTGGSGPGQRKLAKSALVAAAARLSAELTAGTTSVDRDQPSLSVVEDVA